MSQSQTLPARTRSLAFPWMVVVIFVGSLVASLVDPILTKGTLDQIVNDGTQYGPFSASSIIAIGFYLAAVVVPTKIGVADAHGEKSTPFWIAWAAFGVVLFALRWFEDVLIALGDFNEFNPITHAPMAMAIATLYVMTGLAFRFATRTFISSPWMILRSPLRAAEKDAQHANEAVAEVAAIISALEANQSRTARWFAEYSAHQTALRNAEASIKELIRLRLAAHLADPADTSAARRPHLQSQVDE